MDEELLIALGISALVGLIPAAIAHSKRRNFFVWWLYGFLLFIVAIIHVLALRPLEDDAVAMSRTQGKRLCPYCQEVIQKNALVCRFCNRNMGAIK